MVRDLLLYRVYIVRFDFFCYFLSTCCYREFRNYINWFHFFFTQIFVPRIQRTMGSSSTKQIAQDTTSVQTESHSITNANQDSFSVKELVLALAQDPLNVVSCRD